MTASENSDTGTRLGAAAAARLVRYHPGVVVGVLDLRADTRTVAGAGHLYLPGGPAPEGRSVFEIGSITKIFTGLLLAVAVLRGEAALDTPVEELLPHGLRVPRRSGQLITLRHLATHTSGLPRSPLGATAEWRNCNPYSGVTDADLLAALERTRLRRTPGSGTPAYSNFGVALLGLALTSVAAAPDYRALVESRVSRPLGLTHTATNLEVNRFQLAVGHRWRGRPAPHWHLTGMAGCAGLRSTANDLLQFAHAQLDPDSTVLGPAIRLTQRHHHQAGRHTMGLGWIHSTVGQQSLLWHNGSTAGFRSFLGFTPSHAVVMLANSFTIRGADLAGLHLLQDLEPHGPSRRRR